MQYQSRIPGKLRAMHDPRRPQPDRHRSVTGNEVIIAETGSRCWPDRLVRYVGPRGARRAPAAPPHATAAPAQSMVVCYSKKNGREIRFQFGAISGTWRNFPACRAMRPLRRLASRPPSRPTGVAQRRIFTRSSGGTASQPRQHQAAREGYGGRQFPCPAAEGWKQERST